MKESFKKFIAKTLGSRKGITWIINESMLVILFCRIVFNTTFDMNTIYMFGGMFAILKVTEWLLTSLMAKIDVAEITKGLKND